MAFWELLVATSPDTSEGLTNFLWEQGALGVVEEELPGQPPRLRAFYPSSLAAAHLLSAVGDYQAALAALGFPVGGAPAEIGPIVDAEWASAWQQSFPPRLVGERLLIRPPWDGTSAPGRADVVIEPGRAFGTGHHGSTEGCLALLDRLAGAWGGAPPARILDVGIGTGILAIAAIALGAARVRGIDIDPDAVTASLHNAALNDCADRLEVDLAAPADVEAGATFDLVLANLLTNAHLEFAREYRRLVAPGGALVLGGMLSSDGAQVEAALRGVGFALGARVDLEGWASLLLRRAHG